MRFDGVEDPAILILLLGWTVITILVRLAGSLQNNWPLLYWLVMFSISVLWPGQPWDSRYMGVGLLAALLLRYEFMNNVFVTIFRLAEAAVWVWLIYVGLGVLLA